MASGKATSPSPKTAAARTEYRVIIVGDDALYTRARKQALQEASRFSAVKTDERHWSEKKHKNGRTHTLGELTFKFPSSAKRREFDDFATGICEIGKVLGPVRKLARSGNRIEVTL